MKKIFAVAVLFALALTACEQPTDKDKTRQTSKPPTLTVRNMSSFDLTEVKFSSGASFCAPNSKDLPMQSFSTEYLLASDLNTVGYITFTRKDIGIECRTTQPISITEQDNTFTFLDTTVVQEVRNPNNVGKTLAQITFLSQIAIVYGDLPVPKNDTAILGEAVINTAKQSEFILKNNGVGKLLLTGNTPVKIDSSEPGIFSVVQPTSPEVASGGTLPFRINFNPAEAKTYAATVTISSNDQDGDFTFFVRATGVPPKPIATIFYGPTEIPQEGTINAGDVLITRSTIITVAIRNTGTAVLTVETEDITISGANAAAFTKTSSPSGSISAGLQSSFMIEYKPVTEGENNAELRIPTNDSSRNPVIVYLKGTATKGNAVPELSREGRVITHNSIEPFDFGTVELGSSSQSFTFTVRNTGNIDLTLTGTPLVESSNPVFAVTTQPPINTIAPAANTSFILRYTPTTEGEDTGKITFTYNDNAQFVLNVKGTGYVKKPQISVLYGTDVIPQNGTINAGDVLVTLSKDIIVDIKNTGDADLTIDRESITIAGTELAAFTRTTSPAISLIPGGQTSFTIRCMPSKVGENNATLTIPSNDTTRNPFVINLKVIGVKGNAIPELSQGGTVIPDNSITPFDFGTVELGSSSQSITFTVKNNGNIALTLIGEPAVETTNSVFAVTTQPPINTIAPAANTSFILRYTPTAEGENTGKITFTYNENAQFVLNVKGTGYVKRPQISVFYEGTGIPQNGTVDAGEVLVTLSKNINVEIRNTGEARLEIDTENITITGIDAASFNRTTNPAVSMGPGGSSLFTIRCAPTKVGENIAILSIPTNDSFRSPYVINIKTTGVKGNAIPELSQSSTVITNNSLIPIDFGTVELGFTNNLTFNIKNNGNIALVLTETPAVVSSNTVFTIPTQPANTTINPGATVSFIVRYTPTAEGENNGTITFADNSDDMSFTFRVKGTGYEKRPQITVRQGTSSINLHSEYDFGSVLVGKTREITFTIGNSGEANLNIALVEGTRINLSNNAAGLFSVTQQPSTTVIPGGTTTFVIRFNPVTVGATTTAIVQIKTDSRDDEEFSFTVKGTGRNYIIGDEGPGGGIVFYVDNIGNQYKECTKAELGQRNWADAVTLAGNYNGGGFSDWHLPNRNELLSMSEIYDKDRNNSPIAFTQAGWYWTSEQANSNDAWRLYVSQYSNESFIEVNPYPKTGQLRVHAARSFSL